MRTCQRVRWSGWSIRSRNCSNSSAERKKNEGHSSIDPFRPSAFGLFLRHRVFPSPKAGGLKGSMLELAYTDNSPAKSACPE